MKKYMVLACTMTCLSIFADDTINSQDAPSEDIKVVNFCDLTENDLEEIIQGLHPNKIIEFLANTMLPINRYLKGALIHLVENQEKWGTVEINQTFYARYTENELLFSSDLTEWKPLLEFVTGEASINLSIQDGKTSLVIGAQTNRRL